MKDIIIPTKNGPIIMPDINHGHGGNITDPHAFLLSIFIVVNIVAFLLFFGAALAWIFKFKAISQRSYFKTPWYEFIFYHGSFAGFTGSILFVTINGLALLALLFDYVHGLVS